MRSLSTAILGCLFGLSNLGAQNAVKVQEPEFINHFALINADGSLTSLKYEPERPHTDKNKNVTTLYMSMEGEHCPVRVPSNPPVAFAVRLASPEIDPVMTVMLFRVAVVDGGRRLDLNQTVVKTHIMTTNKTQTVLMDKSMIKFDASRYGAASVKLKPSESLPAGEYTITVKGVEGSYCVSVDSRAQ